MKKILLVALCLFSSVCYAQTYTGTFSGNWISEFGKSGTLVYSLVQENNTISGSVTVYSTSVGNVSAMLSGRIDNDTLFVVGTFTNNSMGSFTSETKLAGDSMTGTYLVLYPDGFSERGDLTAVRQPPPSSSDSDSFPCFIRLVF